MNAESHISPPAPDGQQRQAAGKALRETVPRSVHAAWKPTASRSDIVSLLEESNKDRVPDLIPLRYGRMLRSPLAYLRGSAIVMAEDLAGLPTTNIRLQSCGDCHLQNFGWFASPERNLVFDVNDFDETRLAPFEWDIKRLVASVVVAARGMKASKSQQQELGRIVVGEYRERLAQYAQLAPLPMWYERVDSTALLNRTTDPAMKRRFQELVDSARQRTVEKLLPKLTERVDGHLKFKDRPPLLFHPPHFDKFLSEIQIVIDKYRATLSDERRVLLDRYRLVDVAYKVVGVGSVGLRCGIILMLDPDDSPLVLQIKEARASVLEKYVGMSQRTHHGHRIVHGQRVMQAASDIFLGWGNDHDGRSYYIRQLRDMKISIDVEGMSITELQDHVRICGWALARAHAKAGDAASISGYLGTGTQFDEALSDFAMAYANQVQADFETLRAAANSGRIVAKDDTDLVQALQSASAGTSSK